jgi:FkbM family methyltransferase
MLRRVAADFIETLPRPLRLGLKARHYARLLRDGLLDRDPDLRATRLLVHFGEQVLDVGANVGIWTHALSTAVGQEGRVWSFEPVPETFALLRLNVERFGVRNVVPIDRVISDEDTILRMSVPRDARGVRNYHLARVGPLPNAPSFQVQSVRLDSWFIVAGQPRVTFVKIDTEGHELACIRGMLSLLVRCLPALCVEISSDLDDPSSDAARIEDILRRRGYEPHLWTGTSFKRRSEGERLVNCFFLRREHLHSRDIPLDLR